MVLLNAQLECENSIGLFDRVGQKAKSFFERAKQELKISSDTTDDARKVESKIAYCEEKLYAIYF